MAAFTPGSRVRLVRRARVWVHTTFPNSAVGIGPYSPTLVKGVELVCVQANGPAVTVGDASFTDRGIAFVAVALDGGKALGSVRASNVEKID